MAAVGITIRDADLNNIAVDVDFRPQIPDSPLLCTNAQLIAKEVLKFLENIAKQLNDRAHQAALHDTIN